MASEPELAETAALGRRIRTFQADVRDFLLLRRVLEEGVRDLGRLDIVAANAGIYGVALASFRKPAGTR